MIWFLQPSTTGAFVGFDVGFTLGEGLAVGVEVIVGVGEGVGPCVIATTTGVELVACVPEISVKTTAPFHVPAGSPLTVSAQLPLDDLTALCMGVRFRPLSGSATNFTVPVTTGVCDGRVTSTMNTTGLSELLAVMDFTVVVVDSWTGMRSAASGVHVPFTKSRNALVVPRNTLRSTLVPGTPYFLAIPQDVYCQTIQREEQFEVVHE